MTHPDQPGKTVEVPGGVKRVLRGIGRSARAAFLWYIGPELRDLWSSRNDGQGDYGPNALNISPDALETLPGPYIPPRF